MTKKDVRTAVSSSTIGTTIEWYDFFLYGTAAGLVFDHLYFPTGDSIIGLLLSYGTFAVGFLARPLGGLFFGHLGDRIGRKKTLVTTMYIMGIATFLIGAIPTYEQIGIWAPIALILLRIAQGIAIGGEWGGAVLLSVEYAPKTRRGFFGSFPQMGLAFGLLLGTGAFTLLNLSMSDEAFLSWGWRIAFFFSVLLVIVGIYLRTKIAETPSFRAAQKQVESVERKIPLAELLKDRLSRRHLLLGMGTRYAEGVAYNLLAVFIITFATGTAGFSQLEVLLSLMISAVALAVFIPVWGRVSDAIPRRIVFGSGALILVAIVYPAFWAIQLGSWLLLTGVLVVALGVIYPLMYGSMAAFYAELFPPATRYSGISIVYQVSGIFASGMTPFILTWLLGGFGLNAALRNRECGSGIFRHGESLLR
ncbi:MFS transporter [Brevibacterium sp. FAM 27836]|uniref:MFS transporter n=1 Tax=Brevibacterium sp. FAM 27836 TaxID=3446693 RepID=UPI003F50FAF7